MALLLALVAVFSSPVSYYLEIRQYGAAITGAVVMLLFFGYLIRFFCTGRLGIARKGPLKYPFLAYLSVLAVSCVYGLAVSNSAVLIAGDMLQLSELAIFYFLTLAFVKDADEARLFLRYSFFIVIISALVQLMLSYSGLLEENYLFVEGVRTYRIDNDIIPVVFIMLVAFYVDAGKKNRAWLGCALLAAFALLILTYTRSYWLGAAAGMLYIMARKGRRFMMRLSLALIVAAAVLILRPFTAVELA